MSEKDYQTSELRLALDYSHTGDLAKKVDHVLDNRYEPDPAPPKLPFWQRLLAMWS